MNARRVAALQARADHPATPAAEAAACRELLARLAPETACGCRFCEIVATDPWAAARWQVIRDDPRAQVLVCGAWATAASPI
ncbi:hypothetical protein [Mycobacteroides abscessus]|uniref:hypothetical protein n=1 Tax=Mycobacteroides abscessus TaxID=36809 RepID=UPI001877BC43|nr:hypothetical protein [Mycobacteroides abscessus]